MGQSWLEGQKYELLPLNFLLSKSQTIKLAIKKERYFITFWNILERIKKSSDYILRFTKFSLQGQLDIIYQENAHTTNSFKE